MDEQKEMPLDVPQVVVDDLPWSYEYEEWVEVDVREPAVDELVLFLREGWNWPRVGYRGVHQQYFLLGETNPLPVGLGPTQWHPLARLNKGPRT